MPLNAKLASLPHLPPPVLTAYLDINPGNPRNQGTPRGYVTWLRSTGQGMAKQLSESARRSFGRQLERIQQYLQTQHPRGRGLVVLAGPSVWQAIPLQVDVSDELRQGSQ